MTLCCPEPGVDAQSTACAQKCTDAAFCNRLLGAKDDKYHIDPSSLSIAGATVDARLYHKESSAQYRLSLTAFDGVVRLYVNEDAATQRFEVPGVLAPDLATRQVPWDKTLRSATSLQLQIGNVEVQLQYSPLEVTIAVAGQAALSFNSRRMFNFEHLRQKQVLLLPGMRYSGV